MQILVIDDYEPFARSLRLLLDGHQVEVATTAPQALELLLRGPAFDLVLSDLSMEGLAGPLLHARLQEARPELLGRLVFMSGGAYTAEQVRFLEQGPRRCLDKPFTAEEVEAELRRLAR